MGDSWVDWWNNLWDTDDKKEPKPRRQEPSGYVQAPVPTKKLMTDEPWRKIRGWKTSERDKLMEEVANCRPHSVGSDCWSRLFRIPKVSSFNILLTGQIKAGKSSFFNSINGLLSNKVISSAADTGSAAKSLTKELHAYEIKPSPDAAPLPCRIIDTMGLDAETSEVDVRNILKAVDGHVPNKHIFQCGVDFHQGCPGYIKNPTLAEQAHCVAVVVDANQVNLDLMPKDTWKQLRSLRQALLSRNIPTFIILTHIDEACEKVKKDVKNVFKSIAIQNMVSKVGKKMMGLPENQIFPVKNYNEEVDLQDDMDILLLYAMRQMLYSAEAYISLS